MTVILRKQVRADVSPTNDVRWCVELECGHQVWVTQASKPALERRRRCNECEKQKK